MFSTQKHDIIIHFLHSCFVCLSVFHLLFFLHEISPASTAAISVTSVASFTCRSMIRWSSYCYSCDIQSSAHCLCYKLLSFFWRTLCLMLLKLMYMWSSTTINFVNTVNTCYRFRSYWHMSVLIQYTTTGWTLQKIVVLLLFHHYFAVDCCVLLRSFSYGVSILWSLLFSFTVIIEVPFRCSKHLLIWPYKILIMYTFLISCWGFS